MAVWLIQATLMPVGGDETKGDDARRRPWLQAACERAGWRSGRRQADLARIRSSRRLGNRRRSTPNSRVGKVTG